MKTQAIAKRDHKMCEICSLFRRRASSFHSEMYCNIFLYYWMYGRCFVHCYECVMSHEPWAMASRTEIFGWVRYGWSFGTIFHCVCLCGTQKAYSFVNHKTKTSIEVICEWIGISDGNICFLSFSIKSIFSFSFALRILQKCALCNTHWNADLDYNAWSLRLFIYINETSWFLCLILLRQTKNLLGFGSAFADSSWAMVNEECLLILANICAWTHNTSSIRNENKTTKKVRVTPSWRITSFMYNLKIKERPKNQIKLFKTPWII